MKDEPFIPEAFKKMAKDHQAGKKVTRQDVQKAATPQPQSQARVVPQKFTQIIKVEWFREFTWKERLAIFFGAGLVVAIGVATRHRVGEAVPAVLGKVTKERTADEFMKESIKNMIQQKAPKVPIEHE